MVHVISERESLRESKKIKKGGSTGLQTHFLIAEDANLAISNILIIETATLCRTL